MPPRDEFAPDCLLQQRVSYEPRAITMALGAEFRVTSDISRAFSPLLPVAGCSLEGRITWQLMDMHMRRVAP